MNTINSFTETVNSLTRNVNIALSTLQGMSNASTTDGDTVTITVEGEDPVTGDPSLYTYTIPSYQHTLNQLQRISNTVNTFVSGEGVVLLNDGTFRKVKTVPLAKSPEIVRDITPPSRFNIRDNWFFEEMLFPQMYVQFDLKGIIDDRSDRVKTKRLIFDNFNEEETQWFRDNFLGVTLSYEEALNILNESGKRYWIDEEIRDLPIRPPRYTGSFLIKSKKTINNQLWYFLDSINYSLTTEFTPVNDLELKEGDLLRFRESLFRVESIKKTENRVRLTPTIGVGNPIINSRFHIYSTPFEEKIAKVPIGYNECNILFIKGINDDFNIESDSWGESISFYTNDLVLTNSSKTLDQYYYQNVVDFGKQMEGQAKEKFIPAFFGAKPSAPVISSDQFTVNQVNKQLNSSLDTEEIKNTQTQIESSKTIINSLKNTIAQQKAELVELTDPAERADLQGKIDSNVSQLSKKSVEYQSLVKSLSTLAFENDAVLAEPKYRVRGFFPIPEGVRTTNDPSEPLQEIIQFEISYRYLRLDNTGNPLDTYSYVDPSSGQRVIGTFTDWVIVPSLIKKRVYDENLERFTWVSENVGDGEEININQVDIPIRKGEKVQLRIRSISEAGWPNNPVKSDWSDPIIVEFPPNLEGSDQVRNILVDATEEESQIRLDETLNATGVLTHLQDGFPNPNAADGTYFKHQSRFISYNIGRKDIDGNIEDERTIDLQSQLSGLPMRTYVTLTRPSESSSGFQQITGTLQQLLQAIVNSDPSVYDEFQSLIE